MAKSKSSDGNKKKKGNILPFLVIVIIAFLAYKANPEYWQQGKLFQDLQNGGVKKVEAEEVVKAPEAPPEPKEDPNEIKEGSIKGSYTVPRYAIKAANQQDPNYYAFRSISKTIYLVAAKSPASEKIAEEIDAAIQEHDLRKEYRSQSFLYSAKTKKDECAQSDSFAFLCEQCDKKICIINPAKSEFVVVAPSSSAAISKAKALLKSGW